MSALLVALWGIRSARAVLALTSLWQAKEYRVDRLRAHLQLPSTIALIVHPSSTLRWALLAWAAADPAVARAPAAAGALAVLYGVEVARCTQEIAARSLRRPRPTLRALAMIVCSLVILGALFAASKTALPALVLLLALDRATPLVVGLTALASAPAVAIQRAQRIRRAAQRIQARPDLTTVGITGSYGKSSTKEFLSLILEPRFWVSKTPANLNTEIGIAQAILKSLGDDCDVFVCELGAYRPGEIARAASIVRPRIGILTAIGEQHLALFGSKQRLAQAKGELLRALPPEGTAIVNGDDPLCLALRAQTPAQRTVRYGLGAGNNVRADNILIERVELAFRLHIHTTSRTVRAPLLGAQQIPSILAAAAGAHALGLSPDDIVAGIARLRPLPRTMEPRSGPNGAFVIDDTYSANPDGVLAALAYLRTVPAQKRVVVMTTMIELGRAAADAHALVGEALAALRPALVILTARDYATDITRGAASSNSAAPPPIVVETNPVRARARVAALLDPTTAVLLEGRIPERLRQALLTP